MKNIIISGIIGSGKTQLCNKLKKKNPYTYIHIEVDIIGKSFLENFFQENIRWRKKINFFRAVPERSRRMRGEKHFLKHLLFHSLPIEQRIFWHELENFSHPLIQAKTIEIIKKLKYIKKIILWDCAIPEKFFTPEVIQKSQKKISSYTLYTHIFLLKKNRKISNREIFLFLRKQNL